MLRITVLVWCATIVSEPCPRDMFVADPIVLYDSLLRALRHVLVGASTRQSPRQMLGHSITEARRSILNVMHVQGTEECARRNTGKCTTLHQLKILLAKLMPLHIIKLCPAITLANQPSPYTCPQPRYRDVIQAMGSRRFPYGACEGRSFLYPTLLSIGSLMQLSMLFQAPGQRVPRIGGFFGSMLMVE